MGFSVLFFPKISIWEQPVNQRFDDKTGKMGILIALKVHMK